MDSQVPYDVVSLPWVLDPINSLWIYLSPYIDCLRMYWMLYYFSLPGRSCIVLSSYRKCTLKKHARVQLLDFTSMAVVVVCECECMLCWQI